MSDGKKVLFGLLAFFGVVFTADGILIYLGSTSQDGLVTENYYQKGISYNDVIQSRKRQAELGWTFAMTAPEKAGINPLEIRLTDGDGKPLAGKQVEAELRRPAQKGYDLTFALKEVSPGIYRADVTLPLAGYWDLKTQVRDAQEHATFESRFSVSG
jgi:nitrogen fixation protein FixH